MPLPLLASRIRSALGEANIALQQLKQEPTQTDLFAEVTARIQKVSEILQREANLVEERKTPTLKIGSDIVEHTINLDCVREFLQARDEQEVLTKPPIRNKEDFET